MGSLGLENEVCVKYRGPDKMETVCKEMISPSLADDHQIIKVSEVIQTNYAETQKSAGPMLLASASAPHDVNAREYAVPGLLAFCSFAFTLIALKKFHSYKKTVL